MSTTESLAEYIHDHKKTFIVKKPIIRFYFQAAINTEQKRYSFVLISFILLSICVRCTLLSALKIADLIIV